MSQKRNWILVLCLWFSATMALAQAGLVTVKGQVTDATGEPLIGGRKP